MNTDGLAQGGQAGATADTTEDKQGRVGEPKAPQRPDFSAQPGVLHVHHDTGHVVRLRRGALECGCRLQLSVHPSFG